MSIVIVTPQVSELTSVAPENKCYQCLTLFASRAALELHLIKRHNVVSDFMNKKTGETLVKYHCPVDDCKYKASDDETSTRYFSKFKHLKQHYFKCHAAKNFLCLKCDKRFSTAKFLERHVQKECSINFVCVECSLVYKTREALITHCRRKMHFMSHPTVNVSKEDPAKTTPEPTKVRAIYPKPTTRVTASPIQPTLCGQTMETLAAAALSELSWKVVVKRGVDATTQTIRGGGTVGSSKRLATSGHTRRTYKRPRKARKDILTQTAANDLSTSGTQTNLKPLLEPALQDEHRHLHPDHTETHHHHQQHHQPVVHTSAFTEDDFPQFFSSATQTNTELDFDLNMFTDIVNNETQTELISQHELQQQQQQTWGSLDEDDCPALLDSHTQTVDPDEYSHNCTQTCNDILLNDFVELTDIETQTAWASLGIDSSLTTAETQTLL